MTVRTTLTSADAPFVVRSMSEEETLAAGQRLGRLLKPGDVVALFGDLGAGKTLFVRGICRALGTDRNVSSPTFTLLHEYHAPGLAVYHFDFYRITSASELTDVGFSEYLGRDEGICLIEWADRVELFLPNDRYEVRMQAGEVPEMRVIEVRKVGGEAR